MFKKMTILAFTGMLILSMTTLSFAKCCGSSCCDVGKCCDEKTEQPCCK